MSKKVSQVVANRCRELAEVIKKSGCQLSMEHFISIEKITKTEYDKAINICNTAACAAGHIPSILSLIHISEPTRPY